MGHTVIEVHHLTSFCSECGIPYAFDSRNRRSDGKTFWCPNGHAQCFGRSTEAELEEEKDRRRLVETERDTAIRQLGRLKKRIKHGVCPVCKRSFTGLRRHMNRKHPGFVPQ